LRLTLAFKLACLVLASTGLIFLLAFGYSYQVARSLMFKGAEESSRHLARWTVHQIGGLLAQVEPLPQWAARRLAHERPDRDGLAAMLQDMLRVSPSVYGAGVAFEPNAFAAGTRAFAPFFFRREGKVGYTDLGLGTYDYASQDWYQIPRETGRPSWSDPYYDEGGGEALMCSYSVPVFRETDGQDRLVGIVSADVELAHLVRAVSSLKLYRTGYAFLISPNGQFISHPDTNVVFKESIFSLADELGDAELRAIGRKMVRGQEGFAKSRSLGAGQVTWLYYAPVLASGWAVGIAFPEAEVLADLRGMNRVVGWIGVLGFSLLLVVVVVLSTSVTRPIRALARQTHEIARGNLELPVPTVASHDELGDLSHSFEDMRVALKEYVVNLAATTAAKERIESELKIAQTIQRSFLPKRFPPFPNRTEFDIFAELQPAKEVGGDLYDFFLLDGEHLFVSVGDVSGKGVPAALFMAVTKTLVKGVAEQHLTPAQVLRKVNRELYQDNEQMMFVTILCGVLDLGTGAFLYTNAGHLPPLLLSPGAGPRWVDLPPGVLLGITEDPNYQDRRLTLAPGDTLLLYTDGVTEATNLAKQLYGEDRLLALAQQAGPASPQNLVTALVSSVSGFAGTGALSDDVTVLALRYRGRPPTPAAPASLSPGSPLDT
jgi:sigma-B regulation protein RsbU (phosphoserine phosphatase)